LGIDADKYNSINAINPDTTEYSGIGLGQYILKTSVNKVGGEVSFYSSKLGGLGVFISLPLHGE
jgi:sensor histidine kinase regulating citrate/malate metabolism